MTDIADAASPLIQQDLTFDEAASEKALMFNFRGISVIDMMI